VANVYRARGVVTSNVSDLSAFTVASNDGLTYAAGEVVLLVAQTTGSQSGPYVVGTVGGGTAALTRPAWWAAASSQPAGCEFLINEGTSWKHSRWFATVAGAITVGTTSPAFYPRMQKGVTTALSGTPGTKTVTGVWLLATTSAIVLTSNTPGGTAGFLSAPVASRTAGPGASGQFVINSSANDTATVDWVVIN
jgi:hypothetical protein